MEIHIINVFICSICLTHTKTHMLTLETCILDRERESRSLHHVLTCFIFSTFTHSLLL